ncbi:MAG TPA: hypothetical protein VMI75_17215 [Polyangiaceae bacterium]|nr:hypothetical protein [Polyangiaceae bacterium]
MIAWRVQGLDLVLDLVTHARYRRDGTIQRAIRREAQMLATSCGHPVRVVGADGVALLYEVTP